LLQAGYIKQFATRTVTAHASFTRQYYHLLTRFVPYIILAASVVLSVLLPASFPENILPLLNPDNVQQSYIQDYRYTEKLSRIVEALAMYRIRWGTYPQQLSDLVKCSILTTADILLGSGKQLFYVSDSNSYSIEIVQKE
jgi:hypothetical protein